MPFRLPSRINAIIALMLASLLHGTPAAAAGLGDLRLRSALGEPFDALISISSSENESLSTACFQIISPSDEQEGAILRRARIEFRATASGGEIRIHGLEQEREPVIRLALRLRCPDGSVSTVTREYNVLLDPREYKNTPAQPVAQPIILHTSTPAPIATTAPVATPALQTQTITVKKPRTTAASAVVVDQTAPKTKTEKLARKTATQTGQGEFRLQLSTPQLDPAHLSMNLSEDEKLKLRERLLLVESDEQTAQLLQLKDRIGRLEKQLAALQSAAASAPASAPALQISSSVKLPENHSKHNVWWWYALAAALVAATAFFIWKKKQRHPLEQDIFSDFNNVFDDEEGFEDTRPFVETSPPPKETPPSAEPRNTKVTQKSSPQWNDKIDVGTPNNIAEEAQILREHGLTQQAIDLLLHEISSRPNALAAWMKLFDIYRTEQDKASFRVHALAFNEYFASESLWRQVQGIGHEIDPENPLYIVEEAQSLDELAIHATGKEPSGNDDFDLHYLAQPAMETSIEGVPVAEEVMVPLEFHIPGEPDNQKSNFVPFAQAHEQLFGFDAPTLELPALDPSTPPAPLQPEEFASSDTVLQSIARMIFDGQRDAAYQRLEELLYKGSFDQRLTAAKWLDRLLPLRPR